MKALLSIPPRPVTVAPEHQETINRLSRLLAKGRAIVEWERRQREEPPEVVGVQVEEPFRAVQQLRNLVRALATVHGRREVTAHDVELARRVVLSSMPSRRSEMLALLPDHLDGLTVGEATELLHKGETSTSESLAELERVGLVVKVNLPPGGGRPPIGYKAPPEFADLLEPVKPLDHLTDLAGGDLFSGNLPHTPENKKKGAMHRRQGGWELTRGKSAEWGLPDLAFASVSSPVLRPVGKCKET